MIENAYHGSAFGRTCIHNGRVDQLEDRYLGMVEAPSSNLGTSTPSVLIQSNGVDCAATNSQGSILIKFVGSARLKSCHSPQSLARHVRHSIEIRCCFGILSSRF